MDLRAFFVTQNKEKSTDSVEGAAAQESTDSVINFVHASPTSPQPSTAMHTYGAVHMVAARLGCKRPWLGPGWASLSLIARTGFENTTLTLLGVG